MSRWSRHAFWPKAKCDHYTNNIIESMNAWVGKLRGQPLINIIDSVRLKCMHIFYKSYTKANSWEDKVTPKIKKILDKIVNMSRGLKLIPRRNDEFETHEGPCRFIISLEKKYLYL